jgi:hypothetical protein
LPEVPAGYSGSLPEFFDVAVLDPWRDLLKERVASRTSSSHDVPLPSAPITFRKWASAIQTTCTRTYSNMDFHLSPRKKCAQHSR